MAEKECISIDVCRKLAVLPLYILVKKKSKFSVHMYHVVTCTYTLLTCTICYMYLNDISILWFCCFKLLVSPTLLVAFLSVMVPWAYLSFCVSNLRLIPAHHCQCTYIRIKAGCEYYICKDTETYWKHWNTYYVWPVGCCEQNMLCINNAGVFLRQFICIVQCRNKPTGTKFFPLKLMFGTVIVHYGWVVCDH